MPEFVPLWPDVPAPVRPAVPEPELPLAPPGAPLPALPDDMLDPLPLLDVPLPDEPELLEPLEPLALLP